MAVAALVSIIVPCFNHGRYLADCVESIGRQSYGYWECIIVDDGSTDDTSSVCARFAKDSRVRVMRQENQGLSAARNTGIAHAHGDYVQLLDADDMLEKRKLAVQVEHMQSHPDVDIVLGPAAFFGPFADGRLRRYRADGASGATEKRLGGGDGVLEKLLRENIGVVNAALVRGRVFREQGGFDESLRSHEDWDFWLRCALAGCRFEYVTGNESRALVREDYRSMSRVREPMLRTSMQIRERLGSRLPEYLRPLNVARLAETKAALGVELIRHDKVREGWSLYAEAFRSTTRRGRVVLQLVRLIPGAAAAVNIGRRIMRSF